MRVVSYIRAVSSYDYGFSERDLTHAQNAHTEAFAASHGWQIGEWYCDSAERDREFQRLRYDGIRQKFDLVIVDSVFLSGSDLRCTKDLLLYTFHYAGIGFAVAEDGFCSIGKSIAEAESYFDEKYTEYRRRTMSDVAARRHEIGSITVTDVKYGYRLSSDGKLTADPVSAPVVRRIFDLAASGMSDGQIGAILSEERVPCPAAIRGQTDDEYKWTRLTVGRILDRSVYSGHWEKIIRQNAVTMESEPIVTAEVYEAVRRIRSKSKKRAKGDGRHMYSGIVSDRDYGFCLRCRTSATGEKYLVYGSPTEDSLKGKRLPLSQIDDAVSETLRREKGKATLILSMITDQGESVRKSLLGETVDAIKDAAFTVAETERFRMDEYGKLRGGTLSPDEFQGGEAMRFRYLSKAESAISALEEKRRNICTAIGMDNPWLSLYLSWNDGEITREKLKKYVSRIETSKLDSVKVIPRHMEWYGALPAEWREKCGTEKP